MQTLRTLLDPENMGPQTNQGINVSAVAFVFFLFFFSGIFISSVYRINLFLS